MGVTHRNPDSTVIKRSIQLAGHKTSVSLEDQFWNGLREIADGKNMTVSALVEKIDTDRNTHSLSSAIRIYVLKHFRA
jgi:predicted DNA-binding ribbon-helix-helix protein